MHFICFYRLLKSIIRIKRCRYLEESPSEEEVHYPAWRKRACPQSRLLKITLPLWNCFQWFCDDSRWCYVFFFFFFKELDLLNEDANVYKLIGPVLVKQDLAEANANVRKRIDYISAELYALLSLLMFDLVVEKILQLWMNSVCWLCDTDNACLTLALILMIICWLHIIDETYLHSPSISASSWRFWFGANQGIITELVVKHYWTGFYNMHIGGQYTCFYLCQWDALTGNENLYIFWIFWVWDS